MTLDASAKPKGGLVPGDSSGVGPEIVAEEMFILGTAVIAIDDRRVIDLEMKHAGIGFDN